MRVNIQGTQLAHRIDGLEVASTASVQDLRREVSRRLHADCDPAVVRLLYAGQLLTDGRALSSYSMTDGATVHVVVRGSSAGQPSSGGPPQHAGGGHGVNISLDGSDVDWQALAGALPGLLGAAVNSAAFNAQERMRATAGDLGSQAASTAASNPNLFGDVLRMGMSAAAAQMQQRQERAPGGASLADLLANPVVGQFVNAFTAGVTPPAAAAAAASAPPPSSSSSAADTTSKAAQAEPPSTAAPRATLNPPLLLDAAREEVRRASVDVSAVGMGFLCGNALSLQPLRAPLLAAVRAFRASNASTSVTDLAAAEGERATAAAAALPGASLLALANNASTPGGRAAVEEELRHFVKNVYMRLLRCMEAAASALSDAEWATALRQLIVTQVGMLMDRAAQWFPSGGGVDAVIQRCTQLLVEYLQSAQPANWQMMSAMAPSMLPQLARAWHAEYLRRTASERAEDGEAFSAFPTSRDAHATDPPIDSLFVPGAAAAAPDDAASSCSDLDDLVDELMGEQGAAPARTAEEELLNAVNEWVEVAAVPAATASALREIVTRSPATAAAAASATAAPTNDACDSAASTRSSLWTEMWSRHR